MSDIYSQTEVYHVLDTVGKGTFGKVAKCWRGRDGELVAIKVMKTDADKSRVIKNELKLIRALCTANLDKSHIVKFYEEFPGPRCHYLVFELLEKNLYQLQKDNGFKPLAIQNIRTITYQVLKALAKLKELAIIHADLKPENVMIVDQCRYPFRVKVIDFGSASIFHEVRSVREPYIQSRFYRSPEILLGLPFSEKVDMWSLGCIIAELFLGWPLYPGESEYDQVRYICETQGIPSNHLLNLASKANLYFKLMKNSYGGPKWQLKPRSTLVKGGDPKSTEKEGSCERRKYIFRSLDEMESVELTQSVPGYRNEELAAESVDRHTMVELLKRLLTLDSHQRISPSSALRHHFINMQHLRTAQEYKHYYDRSLKCVQEAMIPSTRASGGDSSKSTQDFQPETSHQCQPPVQPRGAFQPQRSAPKQEHQPLSGSCGAAFVRTQRLPNSGATPAAHSQHNLTTTCQVRTTTQQLDDLCIVDEQDVDSSDTPSSSEDSDQAYGTPKGEGTFLPKAGPGPKRASDEEEGAAGSTIPTAATHREEKSLGKSFLSIIDGFCRRGPTSKPFQANGIHAGPCGANDGPPRQASPQLSHVFSSLDSMSGSDTAPPQDFQAESQDFSWEADMVTQDVLTQVLSQNTSEAQEGQMVGFQEMAQAHTVHTGDVYAEIMDQVPHAGGEYILQYCPYEAATHAHQWSQQSGWVSGTQMMPPHAQAYAHNHAHGHAHTYAHGPPACSGHSSHSFFHY